MKDVEKSKEEITKDLAAARARIRGLEEAAAGRQGLEEALRESEERFRMLAENFREALVIYEGEGDEIVYVNPMATELFGLARADLLGAGFDDIMFKYIYEGDRTYLIEAKTKADVARSAGSVEAINLDFRIRRADGALRWVNLTSYPAVVGGKPTSKLYVIFSDVTERKQAERALRESEEKFRNLAEESPNMIFINTKGRILYANKKCEEVMGYTREEFYARGFDFFALIAPESRDITKRNFAAHSQGEEVLPLEYSLITRTGDKIEAVLTTKLITYEGESAILGIVTDITERKRAEVAVRASEERYRRLVETSPDAIVQTDLEGKIVAVNRQAALLYGAEDTAELIGKNSFDLIEPGQRGLAREKMREVFEKGAADGIEYRLSRKDGTYYEAGVSTSLIRDGEGNPSGFIGVIRDVTERARALKTLQESEERYRTLQANIPVGVYRSTVDPGGRVISANPVLARMFGFEAAGAMIGKRVAGFYADPAARAEFLGALAADGAVTDYEVRLRRNDGAEFWGSLSARAVYAEGKLAFLDGILEDVTERKRAEEKLKETAEELSRSNRELGQFASAASHDLKEPLRTITSYLQLLERRHGDQLGAGAREFVEGAVTGAKRMHALIQDLLDYSRVGARGQPFEAADLGAVCDEARANLQTAIEENEAVVTREELPTLEVDASQILQLLQNLLENALKFRAEAPPVIRVTACRDGPEWKFAVSDNGLGLAPEYGGRIFGVFERLHAPEEYAGTGIGLAICEKIVTRHGGRIWVESEPGRGATFYFTLPEGGGGP